MKADDLKRRTKEFAHRCVRLSMTLPENKLGYHIQGQLIRCATSVTANYRSACVAQSQKSFIAKISIVIEEVDEADFWIEFIEESRLIKTELLTEIKSEARELLAIFIASRKTISNKLKSTLSIVNE